MHLIGFTIISHNSLAVTKKRIVFKCSEIRGLSLSVRHYAGITDKLLWGHDNNKIGDTGYTSMSKHLILATVEFVNNYLPKVYPHWHLCSSASACASFLKCLLRSAFWCKLYRQHFNVVESKQFPSCHLWICALQLHVLDTQYHFGRCYCELVSSYQCYEKQHSLNLTREHTQISAVI